MAELVLGTRCPSALAEQLKSIQRDVRAIYEVVSLVDALANEPSWSVWLVRTASQQLAVLKSYQRSSLDAERKLQVGPLGRRCGAFSALRSGTPRMRCPVTGACTATLTRPQRSRAAALGV